MTLNCPTPRIPLGCAPHNPLTPTPPPTEAAIRSVRQAQAEDLVRVDLEQLEKVLPQLVGGRLGARCGPTGLALPEHLPLPSSWTSRGPKKWYLASARRSWSKDAYWMGLESMDAPTHQELC